MKKVQDYYFKKAKKEGYPARSVYKLAEAHEKYGFLKRGDKVIDVGSFPGSWSMYASKICKPQGLIVGVDLQAGKRIQQSGRAPVEFVRGDITDDETLVLIRSHADIFNVVLSDMAPKTTGNKWSDQQRSLDLSRKAFDLCKVFLVSGGTFYCKVFEGEDFKEFYDELRPYFTRTKIVKPKSSRKESREIFVLGTGFNK